MSLCSKNVCSMFKMGQHFSRQTKVKTKKTNKVKANYSYLKANPNTFTKKRINYDLALTPRPYHIDKHLVPKWIHRSYFEEILRQVVPDFTRIREYRIEPATTSGETYSSLLLKVSFKVLLNDGSVKVVNFMMKVPHESAKTQQMLKTVNFFAVENATYTDIISRFENLYRSKGLSIRFAPRAYKFNEGVNLEQKLANTMLMTDLSEEGYRNVNRLTGLNVEQTKLVLRKLAQYHAAGAHCRVVNGPYSKLFTQPMFGSNNDRAISILDGIMGPFKKMFLEHLYFYENGNEYYEKFETLFANMSRKFLKMSAYDPDEFNVMNHGDCWINNLLFKFDHNGNCTDFMFVDFQLPKYCHPAADLLNFIMTSVQIDYKLQLYDYFIKFYHDALIEHLHLLEYTERFPSLAELHMKLYKYGIWAITASVMVLPIVLNDMNEEIMYKNHLYTNPRFKTHIEKIMPWLDNRGLLED